VSPLLKGISSLIKKQTLLNMEMLNQEDIKEFINTAMHKLDKEDRKIFRALYFKNISIHQLSKNLVISCSTARYMRDKALNNLRKLSQTSQNKFGDIL